jgi:hypothetical protein
VTRVLVDRTSLTVFVRCVAFLLFVGGCAPGGWYRTTVPQPFSQRSFHRHAQYQVWSHGTVARWHGVTINSDSLRGIPFNKPLDCDSCRHSIRLIEVDSLKRGRPSIGSALLVIPAALLVEMAVCALGGPCHD